MTGRRRIAAGIGGAAVIAIVLLLFITARGDEPPILRVATGTPGGTYLPLGREFALILSALDDPIEARADATAGSRENIARLLNNEADLALVQSVALAGADATKVRAVAHAYMDVVQVVVRADAGIRALADLDGKNIFVGREGSGTRLIAEALLGSLGIDDYTMYPNPTVMPRDVAASEDEAETEAEAEEPPPAASDDGPTIGSFADAALKLAEDEIQAAIFSAGVPTTAVTEALRQNCRLLSLGDDRDKIVDALGAGAQAFDVPKSFYEGQKENVSTIGVPVFLVGRTALDGDLVARVLDTLFDNIGDLLVAHSGVGEIKLQNAFPPDPPVQWHAGAERFRAQESEKLIIATGTINGKYHRIGKVIEEQLESEGIPTRAIHTDGSLANLRLMQEDAEHTLSILQYDVALAAGGRGRIYRDDALTVDDHKHDLKGISRVATLHDERIHVVIRREKNSRRVPTIDALRGRRVCLGPRLSGTAVAASAILRHYGIRPSSHVVLPVRDMVNQLRAGTVDAGFFISSAPTPDPAMSNVLQHSDFQLLSIDPHVLREVIISTSALAVSEIPPGTYGCMRGEDGAVTTVATTAVLVVTKDFGFDVDRITRALIRAAAFLGLEGGPDRMADPFLPSLPLHADARSAYRAEGHMASPDRATWVEIVAAALTILLFVLGAGKATRLLVREWIVNEIKDRILAAPMEGRSAAIQPLFEIRRELLQRARMSWWHPGKLDKARLNDVDQIIDSRIREAKASLMRSLLADVTRPVEADHRALSEGESSLSQRAWRHAVDGELDESQLSLILRALEEQHAEERP